MSGVPTTSGYDASVPEAQVTLAPTPEPAPATADGERSTLSDSLPPLKRLFAREPALGITAAYLLVAMAGIFHGYRYYRHFGIPILSLSQVSDFLVAGIQEPIALLLVLSTLPLIWVFDRVNVRARRRYRAAHARLQAVAQPAWWQRLRLRWLSWQLFHARWYLQVSYLAVLFLYGWMFVALYADYQVARIERGGAPQVRVWQGGQLLRPSSGETWRYLGAVSNYVFVYDPGTRSAQILPVESIERIEPVAPVKAGNLPVVVPVP